MYTLYMVSICIGIVLSFTLSYSKVDYLSLYINFRNLSCNLLNLLNAEPCQISLR